jgi:hypothetical protein
MLLLRELGSTLPGRVAVLDPCPPPEKRTVHWSYWSHAPTLYDRFAVGSWQKARVAETPAESIAPYTLRLVRSTDVFAHIAEELRTVPVEWLRASAHSIEGRKDGTYEVITDGGAVRAGWVGQHGRGGQTTGGALEAGPATAAEPTFLPAVAAPRRGVLATRRARPHAAAGPAAQRHARSSPRPVAALHRRGASTATAGGRLRGRAPGRAQKTVAPAASWVTVLPRCGNDSY